MRRLGGRRAVRHSSRRMRRRRVRMRRRRVVLVGGMVAIAVAGTATAIKLSKKDADRIEEHTGQKPEDLSEEQLEQAISDLDIETQELTDADVAAMESADPEPAEPATAAVVESSATTPAAAQMDYISELERLAELRDKGIIMAEDFDAKKEQLLGL